MACRGVIPRKVTTNRENRSFPWIACHYQIMQWSMLDAEFQLQVLDWGWMHKGSRLAPITDMDIAPPSLKDDVIRCNCKTSTKNPCSIRICTCRKYGMPGLSSRGGCR